MRRFPRVPYSVEHIRMTLTPLAADHVQQVGERSDDGGASWTVLYDLHYFRRKSGTP